MSQLIKPLILDFPELFTSLDEKAYARLGAESEEGIRINADEIEYIDGVFSCYLLIEYTFSLQFSSCFHRLAKAIVVSIENADTGQCITFSLIDPHKKYPPFKRPNYNTSNMRESSGHVTAFRKIPLSMELKRPGWGPHLFIRAQLQGFCSNVLGFNFGKTVTLSSYLDNKPYTITIGGDDDE